jgi:hypothetical protein
MTDEIRLEPIAKRGKNPTTSLKAPLLEGSSQEDEITSIPISRDNWRSFYTIEALLRTYNYTKDTENEEKGLIMWIVVSNVL